MISDDPRGRRGREGMQETVDSLCAWVVVEIYIDFCLVMHSAIGPLMCSKSYKCTGGGCIDNGTTFSTLTAPDNMGKVNTICRIHKSLLRDAKH